MGWSEGGGREPPPHAAGKHTVGIQEDFLRMSLMTQAPSKHRSRPLLFCVQGTSKLFSTGVPSSPSTIQFVGEKGTPPTLNR